MLRFRNSAYLVLFSMLVLSAQAGTAERRGFYADPSAAGWPVLLRAMGLVETSRAEARVIVVPPNGSPEEWLPAAEDGAVLVIEGDTPLSRAVGIEKTTGTLHVSRIRDARDSDLKIQWQEAQDLPVFRLPSGAQLFTADIHGRAPLMAGVSRGNGAVLWLATGPGAEGFERFPYIPQALADLGVRSTFESRRLWAFFDASFRDDLNAEKAAAEWRQQGIAAIHVGAWDFYDPTDRWDRYLRDLIAACHRHSILVYAWLELPHVSTKFWNDHPEWREKTARLRDAAVDWRLLMNLADPACRDAVEKGVQSLMNRFDWDGVNLAELYFDGVDGMAKPAEFTPMNDLVRRQFQVAHGFDPIDLFRDDHDSAHLRTFLDYRADLAGRLQEEWIETLEKMRADKPGLDLVLTHVDDRFDPRMRDAIGADAARALRELDHHALTFIVEDPATVWRLGPKRYTEIARRYAPLTSHHDRVGVDINVVHRYGKAYPTALQTGAELLELIHTASESFARVALYSETTVADVDRPFLAASAAVVTHATKQDGKLTVESPYGVGVRWKERAALDGQPWPVHGDGIVWVPAGRHVIGNTGADPPAAVLDFNATLDGARYVDGGIELSYRAEARAFATVNAKPTRVVVDGAEAQVETLSAGEGRFVLLLPRGTHRAVLQF